MLICVGCTTRALRKLSPLKVALPFFLSGGSSSGKTSALCHFSGGSFKFGFFGFFFPPFLGIDLRNIFPRKKTQRKEKGKRTKWFCFPSKKESSLPITPFKHFASRCVDLSLPPACPLTLLEKHNPFRDKGFPPPSIGDRAQPSPLRVRSPWRERKRARHVSILGSR